jgi:hypothetical protein
LRARGTSFAASSSSSETSTATTSFSAIGRDNEGNDNIALAEGEKVVDIEGETQIASDMLEWCREQCLLLQSSGSQQDRIDHIVFKAVQNSF